ncbi:MAG: F0F1 ATP synthase subunit delta [Verrucomicrobiota bacterium]
MKRDKKITQFAKKLVELSKDGDVVTEPKVSEVLAGLRQVQPRHHYVLLKCYLEYIRREVAAQTAVVATPSALSPEALAAIESNFTAVYGRKITAVTENDPSLIAGVRVRVGDDLYDASVAGRLKRLAEQVN